MSHLPPSRRRTARALLNLLLITATGMTLGCSKGDTVVTVRVLGTVQGIEQLSATVTVADQVRILKIPGAPRPISLPTTFTVQLSRSIQGPLQVALDALNGSGVVIARGSASVTRLAVGEGNQLQVTLLANDEGSTADGGADDSGADGGAPDAPLVDHGGGLGGNGAAGQEGSAGGAGNGGAGGTDGGNGGSFGLPASGGASGAAGAGVGAGGAGDIGGRVGAGGFEAVGGAAGGDGSLGGVSGAGGEAAGGAGGT